MEGRKYTFYTIERCNMCGMSSSGFSILGKRLDQTQGFFPNKLGGITTTINKCKNCGLIFSNPQPVPDSIETHYEIQPERYWDEKHFIIAENYFLGAIIWLKRLIDFKPGLKTLDVGAGIGKCMTVLKNIGCDVYGLEPSKPFYKMAIETMNIDPSRLTLSTIEEADYPDDYFDFITFGAVLEHLYDPSNVIRKSLKWLKKGGIIHVEVPNSKWLINKWININYRLRGMDYVGNLSPMHPPFHLYEFSIKSFEENSKQLDYSIADHGYYVSKSYLPKIFDFFVKPYMKWSNTGMQLVVWLKKTNVS